jgi:tRNA dimethylallyltransferase
MAQPFVIVVCGPTASGKSQLALQLALRLKTVILSADSRQIYREFDIGTAKPSPADQARVPHYLIDICDPRSTLTLADYQLQAQQLIEQLPSPLLLVGGTGLYLKALTRGLVIPRVAPQPDLRQQLQSLGQAHCYQLLSQVDSEACQKIKPADAVRTLRALEVYYVTGRSISQQQGEKPPTYPIVQIGLSCDSKVLNQWIAQRTQAMLDQGLVAEVAGLMQKYGPDLPLLQTLGYAEIKAHLAGQISLEEAQKAITLHTRQFAKRQRTWFRGQPDIHWFEADHPDLLEQVWQSVWTG